MSRFPNTNSLARIHRTQHWRLKLCGCVFSCAHKIFITNQTLHQWSQRNIHRIRKSSKYEKIYQNKWKREKKSNKHVDEQRRINFYLAQWNFLYVLLFDICLCTLYYEYWVCCFQMKWYSNSMFLNKYRTMAFYLILFYWYNIMEHICRNTAKPNSVLFYATHKIDREKHVGVWQNK